MSLNRSEASYITHDIIPSLSRHGYPGAGDHEGVKINEVPIYRPSGGRSGSTMDIVYYHNGEPLLLVEAKRKYKSHDDALSEAKNYHLNFPRKDRAYTPSGKAPEFLATTVGNDIQFYKIRYEIENNSPVAISEKIDILSWDDLLDSYGLKPAYKAKKLAAASFRSELLNHLTAIYVVPPKKITPEVVKNVAWQILQYLEDDVNYQSRPPYTSLDREVGRQSEIRDLFRLFDLKGSLGPELAEEFRNFILRSFQGREFNQFMTEQCVIDFMCELVGDLKSKVLDFECGSGGFLASAISHWNLPAGNIMGVDLDDLPYLLAKTYIAIYFKISGAKISDIPIRHDNGLFYWGNDWDLVISNPAGGNKYPPKSSKGQSQREINSKYALKKVFDNLESDLDQNTKQDKLSEYNFSIQQAIRSCKVGGKICLILPEGFFSNSQDEILRKYVAKHCKVLAIVSLPRGVFKRGTSTKSASRGSQTAQMKMSILYAQKTSPVVDKAGLDLDGLDLSYPIFLSSIADPESTSGSIETWLGPRLNTVLEQWQSWQKTGELTKPSFKGVETSKAQVQETMINKADKKEIAKPSKPQHKSTHKVDEHLKGYFKEGKIDDGNKENIVKEFRRMVGNYRLRNRDLSKYLYFAYGSNMCHAQMEKRCPDSKYLHMAYLDGYRFVYDGRPDDAKANIIESPKGRVYGGLFEVTEHDWDNLDRYEGYPKVYQRKEFKVVGNDGKEYTVFAYYRTGQKPGKPNNEYRSVIMQGAKDCGLPTEHIKSYL